MSETYRRAAGDQATLGYRQLPGVGSEGPDIKTLVFAGLGVALGIMVGTVMAEAPWRSLNPPAQHQPVQASSSGPQTPDRSANKAAPQPAAKASQTPPVQAQSTAPASPQPLVVHKAPDLQASVALRTPVVRTPSVTGKESGTHASASPREATEARKSSDNRRASHSRQAYSARKASGTHQASVARAAPGARRVSAAHRRRPVHGLAAWRKHLGRRNALRRPRLRSPRKTAIAAALLPAGRALSPDEWSTPFVFTVEGELTVSAYDALAGTIETYEGESFALHKAASASMGMHGADLSSNIHYKCNQFGNCTLHAGQFVFNATRTR
jgi:hypothetical protein